MALAVLSMAIGAVLATLSFLGLFVRPSSDDWCLVPVGRDEGFLAVVSDIYLEWNGRWGNGALLGLLYTWFPVASKVLPGLVLAGILLSFTGIWAILLRRVLGATKVHALVAAAALAGAGAVVLLLAKPLRYPTLFHSATVVSHTVTVMLGALVAVVAIMLLVRGRTVTAGVVTFLTCLFLGTLNEAFTAVCLVTVTAAAAGGLLVRRRPWSLVATLSAAATGLLLGFLTVYFSPGSRSRQQLITSQSVLEPDLWWGTVTNWWSITTAVVGSPEMLLLAVAALLTGLLVVRIPPQALSRRAALAGVLVPCLWAVTASLAAVFVYVYSFNGQLAGRERVWPSITISLVIGVTWLLLLTGSAMGEFLERLAGRTGRGARRSPVAAVLVVAAAASLGPLGHVAAKTRDLARVTVLRAVEWDRQDVALRHQVAGGTTSISLAPVPIDGLYEPFYPNVRHKWPAQCIPDYYGVDEVLPVPVESFPAPLTS